MEKTKSINEIAIKLEEGIKNLYNSEAYQSYLTTMSRFHHYSYRNSLLIWLQNPSASYVAGYKAWINEFNRYVRKGEKGIKIFAPILVKKDDAEELVSFKTTTVFDISQTEGKELPKGFTKQLLGDIENEEVYINAIKKISPVPIEYSILKKGANGFYHPKDKKIVINENLSSLQKVKTMIHELTHALLHDPSNNEIVDPRTREIEAESVAYTVLQHYGFDTSDYSFGYIADWSSSKELVELKSSLNKIVNTANSLICKIDNEKTA